MNRKNRRINKVREFKGDALARFIAVLIFNDIDSIHSVCSNANFSRAAADMGLEATGDEFEFYRSDEKGLANAYELELWSVFEQDGLSEAIEFFKETAIRVYEESLN